MVTHSPRPHGPTKLEMQIGSPQATYQIRCIVSVKQEITIQKVGSQSFFHLIFSKFDHKIIII
jgi:hypothetical protein